MKLPRLQLEGLILVVVAWAQINNEGQFNVKWLGFDHDVESAYSNDCALTGMFLALAYAAHGRIER